MPQILNFAPVALSILLISHISMCEHSKARKVYSPKLKISQTYLCFKKILINNIFCFEYFNTTLIQKFQLHRHKYS